MPDMVTMMNAILAEGSEEYQNRVPQATQDNITAVGNPILEYTTVQNEFLNALINKIALTFIHNKTAVNKLAVLKKGNVPLGQDVEEIFANMANANEYDPTGSGVFAQNTPDVKSMYHRLNRRAEYVVTINNPRLRTAFTSWGKLEELLSGIINTLYSGDNFDEYVLTKNLIGDAIVNDLITLAPVTDVTDQESATTFVKSLKKASKYFQYPSTLWNKYADIQTTLDPLWGGTPVRTWTPLEDQILIIRADVATDIDVDVLARAFNMDKAQYLANSLEVDNFGVAENCLAILADKSLFQIYDNMNEMTSQYNAQGLFWNYFWHHWQTYSISYFANACAFIVPEPPQG